MTEPRRNLPSPTCRSRRTRSGRPASAIGGALLALAVVWAAGAPLPAAAQGDPAALEALTARVAALEARVSRLAAIDALRAALSAGRPLGPALAGLREAPAALTRFATTPPPTEAALRLAFEDAVRAARSSSEPARDAQGVLDSAVARLSSLVTVRRGEALIWGDPAATELEAARRALDVGDLEGAVTKLDRLSAPSKQAMQGWMTQAQALVAARAALAGLAQ